MSKKLMISLFVAVIALTLLVTSGAFAQENDPTLEGLFNQIYELRREVVERRVELGEIDAEEGNNRLEFMEKRFEDRKEDGFRGFGGMHHRGWGQSSRSEGYMPCH